MPPATEFCARHQAIEDGNIAMHRAAGAMESLTSEVRRFCDGIAVDKKAIWEKLDEHSSRLAGLHEVVHEHQRTPEEEKHPHYRATDLGVPAMSTRFALALGGGAMLAGIGLFLLAVLVQNPDAREALSRLLGFGK